MENVIMANPSHASDRQRPIMIWSGRVLSGLFALFLYLVPRTSIFGAVLTMGLLGGAMATQLRAQAPLFSHALFSVYVGLFMWAGLWLRSPRLRKVFPFVREED